jgi:hypothetical protein
MAIARRDDWVTNPLGNALAGTQVYYCTQPANTSTTPPSPLASVFSDSSGTPAANPQVTDGFGHAVAYLSDSLLYTIVYVNPIFAANVVLKDQAVGFGTAGVSMTPFAGTPQGTIDGSNRIFTLVNGSTPLTQLPTQQDVWLNFPLILGLGYTIGLSSGVVKITYATPPQPASGGNPADAIWAQGLIPA